MADDDAPAKLKHFNAHVAIVPQSSALSHWLALCGQQSMSDMSVADMSLPDTSFAEMSLPDMSAETEDRKPAIPAAGSVATDRAISRARIVRPMRIDRAFEGN